MGVILEMEVLWPGWPYRLEHIEVGDAITQRGIQRLGAGVVAEDVQGECDPGIM